MPADKILLEIPVFDFEAALNAATYGADRLELCSSYLEGGLTPGAGLYSILKSKIEIPIFVMIRPRGGDFVYSNSEIEVMMEEIRIFSSLGADGFVFGVLNQDGSVHKNTCRELLELAGDKPCTFHRAFDVSSNLMKSLEDVIDCGFRRILTSGGKKSVKEGLPIIKELLMIAKERISIMPGGGMMPEFVDPLRETGYLKEVHASCKTINERKSKPQNKEAELSIIGNVEDNSLAVDKNKIERFLNVLV